MRHNALLTYLAPALGRETMIFGFMDPDRPKRPRRGQPHDGSGSENEYARLWRLLPSHLFDAGIVGGISFLSALMGAGEVTPRVWLAAGVGAGLTALLKLAALRNIRS